MINHSFTLLFSTGSRLNFVLWLCSREISFFESSSWSESKEIDPHHTPSNTNALAHTDTFPSNRERRGNRMYMHAAMHGSGLCTTGITSCMLARSLCVCVCILLPDPFIICHVSTDVFSPFSG